MAYLSSTSAKITPENYSARVKSITVRVCITNCTGTLYITDILLQAGSGGDGMGRPSLRDEVDAGWLRLLLSGWRRLSTGNSICVS